MWYTRHLTNHVHQIRLRGLSKCLTNRVHSSSNSIVSISLRKRLPSNTIGHRDQLPTGRSKTMTGNMIHQVTATMPPLHSSLPGIHHVATGTRMTVDVLKQWPIGPLQPKTTDTTMRDALTTINTQSMALSSKASPTKSVSIRQYLGHCAIRLLFMDSCLFCTKFAGGEKGTKSTCFSAISYFTGMHHPPPA